MRFVIQYKRRHLLFGGSASPSITEWNYKAHKFSLDEWFAPSFNNDGRTRTDHSRPATNELYKKRCRGLTTVKAYTNTTGWVFWVVWSSMAWSFPRSRLNTSLLARPCKCSCVVISLTIHYCRLSVLLQVVGMTFTWLRCCIGASSIGKLHKGAHIFIPILGSSADL